jgi:hypothetical protein
LTHLFTRGCSASYRAHSSLSGCISVHSEFEDQQDLSHFVMSLLISSHRNSPYALSTIASVLGIDVSPDADIAAVSQKVEFQLINKRSQLIKQFTEDHPSTRVFDALNSLPLASLVSRATLHGLPCHNPSPSTLHHLITNHFTSGACG